jgi:hypothetical protein
MRLSGLLGKKARTLGFPYGARALQSWKSWKREGRMIREFSLSDLAALESSAVFPLENLRGKRFLFSQAIERNGKLVGSFHMNETTELALILDKKASPRDRVLAVKELTPWLIKNTKQMGIPETHSFVSDPGFAQILVQHFGFEYCMGRALVWRHHG